MLSQVVCQCELCTNAPMGILYDRRSCLETTLSCGSWITSWAAGLRHRGCLDILYKQLRLAERAGATSIPRLVGAVPHPLLDALIVKHVATLEAADAPAILDMG